MKYVRTEDGIFRIDNDKISVINGCQFVSIRGGILHALDVKDKVADTIKELIDVYIIKDKDERLPFVSKTDFDYANNKDKNNFKVYGAIWVIDSNGVPTLKSVAKANEKGELELL